MIETTNLPEILAQVSEAVTEIDEAGGEGRFEGMADGTNPKFEQLAQLAELGATLAALTDKLTFADVANLAHFAVVAETDPKELRTALVHQAALLVRWVAEIDNRNN